MANKTMTLTQVKNTPKSFDDTHTVSIGGFKPGKGGNKHPTNSKAPKWFSDFEKKQDALWQQQLEFNKQMLDFKNYVLDQFKKHGWTLNKIQTRLDNIVTKNNLKE